MPGPVSTDNEHLLNPAMDDCLLRCGHVLERLSGYRIDSYDLNDFTESIAASFQDEICNDNASETDRPLPYDDWQNCDRLQPEDSSLLFAAGYNDCMNEAIRFLIEEEDLDADHPVVRSLRSHLEDAKERVLSSIPSDTDNNNLDIMNVAPRDLHYDCFMAVNLLDSSSRCNSG